jgi:hypothetical protein
MKILESKQHRRMRLARTARHIAKRAKKQGLSPLEYMAGVIQRAWSRSSQLHYRAAKQIAAELGY